MYVDIYIQRESQNPTLQLWTTSNSVYTTSNNLDCPNPTQLWELGSIASYTRPGLTRTIWRSFDKRILIFSDRYVILTVFSRYAPNFLAVPAPGPRHWYMVKQWTNLLKRAFPAIYTVVADLAYTRWSYTAGWPFCSLRRREQHNSAYSPFPNRFSYSALCTY